MESFSILSIKRNKKTIWNTKLPPPPKGETSFRHINGIAFGSAFLIILNYVALI